MIKLENCEVLGWEHAIRGMRNPKNSWGRSDSLFGPLNVTGCGDCPYNGNKCLGNGYARCINLGPNDHELIMKLAKGGSVHAKYRRMITVYVDITAPLYWWKEFDTYKVGTVANSCSTMHKIHAKEFTLEDFSHEHLTSNSLRTLESTILALNYNRHVYINGFKGIPGDNSRDVEPKDKKYWWQMIQLLPSSYNQKRTVMLNYEVLANIYKSRRNHKLDEWHVLCDWIDGLPYSELITGRQTENDATSI